MVRTILEVPKRAKKSITIQVEKLVKKYGERSVRLVVLKMFQQKAQQSKLQKEIEAREIELQNLKQRTAK